MRKLFIYAMMMFALASCSEETEKDRVENAFKDYIENEYNDTRELDRIVSIEPFDTISAREVLTLFDSMESKKSMMLEEDVSEMMRYKGLLEKDTTNIITYKVNVILKSYEKEYPTAFYVLKKNGKYKVQSHEMNIEEMPSLFRESASFLQEAIFRTEAKQILGL